VGHEIIENSKRVENKRAKQKEKNKVGGKKVGTVKKKQKGRAKRKGVEIQNWSYRVKVVGRENRELLSHSKGGKTNINNVWSAGRGLRNTALNDPVAEARRNR